MLWWVPKWWGRGFGWRWCYRATGLPGWMRYYPVAFGYPPFQPSMSPGDELKMLEEMRKDLEAELEDINRRIEELRRELGK